MALDNATRLTQNIRIKAQGDELLRPLVQFGREISKRIAQLEQMNAKMAAGGKANVAGLQQATNEMQKLIGQYNTLANLINDAKGKRRQGLLDDLSDQNMGKRIASASKLQQELGKTTNSADALEVRLAMLYRRFNELGEAGRKVGQRDLNKAFGTEKAIKDVKRLQTELERLDNRILGPSRTGGSEATRALRGDITKAEADLLSKIQGNRRVNFTNEIAQIQALVAKYKDLAKAEIDEAIARDRNAAAARRTMVDNLNLSPELRNGRVERLANQMSTPSGVSGTVPLSQAEANVAASQMQMQRIVALQQKAFAGGATTASVERLNRAYKALETQLAKDLAVLKQVNYEVQNTPEAKAARARQMITQTLFGDGGLAFGSRIAGAAVISTGVFAAINAVQQGIKNVLEFEKALDQLQAIAGATNGQMRGLSSSILDVAASSNSSIVEITKSATVIAQAGYSASETAQVLKDAINLAVASGSSPSSAVDTLTSALGAFRLQASESARTVDVLVTGLNRSKLSIEQMQSAIQYAGATAKEQNVSFEELTTVAASIANAGIRSGSTIGTGLRQLLVDLQTPTEKFKKNLKDAGLTLADVDVKTRGFANVIKTLKTAGFGSDAAFDSFETRAAAAFLAFKNQIDVYDQLALSISEGGSAAEAQEKAMDNLSSRFQQFLNVLQTVIIKLSGPFVSTAKTIIETFTGVLSVIDKLVSAFGNAIDGSGRLGQALTSMLMVGGAGFAVGGPWGALIGGLLGFASGMANASTKMDELETKTNEASAKFDSQQQTLMSLDDAMNHLIQRQNDLRKGGPALQTEVVNLTGKFEGLVTYLKKTANSYDDIINGMRRLRGEALKQAVIDAQLKAQATTTERDAVQQQLDNKKGFTGYFGKFYSAERYSDPSTEQYQTANQGLSSDNPIEVGQALVKFNNYRNRLKAAGRNTTAEDEIIEALEQRLKDVKKLRSLQNQLDLAMTMVQQGQIQLSDKEQAIYADQQEEQGNVQNAIERLKTKKDNGLVVATADRIRAKIANLKKELGLYKAGTMQAIQIANDISGYEDLLFQLTREDRTYHDEKNDKAKPGQVMHSKQVGDLLKKEFGARVTDDGKRSYAKQKYLYDHYKGVAKPGTSSHEADQAIDISPIPGTSPDQVVAFLEGLGLEMTEVITKKHGTGTHWHFAWKAKTSQFLNKEEAALQSLKNARASRESSAVKSQIQTILAQAGAGTATPADLQARMNSATGAYRAAMLKQYDTEHDPTNLRGAKLTEYQEGRKALQDQITEDIQKFQEQLHKQIKDIVDKNFQAALNAIDRAEEANIYAAGYGLRNAQGEVARSQNNFNKNNGGAGTDYYLQRKLQREQNDSDFRTLNARKTAEAAKQAEIDKYNNQLGFLTPGSEEYTDKVAKVAAAQEDLNKHMRETAQLQQDINDRTGAYTQLPLTERLRESVAAWAENSGAMDSWSKMMEDNVGPLLDMIVDKLTEVGTKLLEGTMTVKKALGTLLAAIADFIVKLIAKAIALQAVKWLLRMVGLDLGKDADTGMVTIVKHKFGGGLIGPPQHLIDGGRVKGGFTNYDNVPILAAEDEYMVRGASVRSLGLPFMDAINRDGAKALSRLRGNPIMMGGGARQETNVYIVKPEEHVRLGPNDVRLIIADDIMQGGQTKQLIKQVVHGA